MDSFAPLWRSESYALPLVDLGTARQLHIRNEETRMAHRGSCAAISAHGGRGPETLTRFH